MGLILFAAMAAGCAVGLIITAILGTLGIRVTGRRAKSRVRAWWCFAAVFAALLALFVFVVHQYPYDPVRPGSDYDVAMKNLFLQGLGYGAAPGIAALLASLAVMLSPKTAGSAGPTEKQRG